MAHKMGAIKDKIDAALANAANFAEELYYDLLPIPLADRYRYLRRLEASGRIDEEEAIDRYEALEEEFIASDYTALTRFYYDKGYALLGAGYTKLALEAAITAFDLVVDDADWAYANDLMGAVFQRIGWELSDRYYYEDQLNYNTVREAFSDAAEYYQVLCNYTLTHYCPKIHCRKAIKTAFLSKNFTLMRRIYEKVPFQEIAAGDLLRISESYYQEGDYRQALLFVGSAIKYANDSMYGGSAEYVEAAKTIVRALFLRGWCLFRLGDLSGALSSLNRVVAMPGSEEEWSYAGEARTSITYMLYSQYGRRGVKASLGNLLKTIGSIDVDYLVGMSRYDGDDNHMLTIEEVVEMFARSTVMASFYDEGRYLLDIAGKFGDYLERLGKDISVDIGESERDKIETVIVKTIKVLIDKAEYRATWRGRTRSYEAASDITDSAVYALPKGYKLNLLWARTTRRLASCSCFDANWGNPAELYRSAVDRLEYMVGERGGIKNIKKLPEDLVVEYGLANSEYAEHLIDMNIGKREQRIERLDIAEKILSLAKDIYPMNPEAHLDWAWNEYYRAKYDRTNYPAAIERALKVYNILSKMPTAAPSQVGEALRIYLWSVIQIASHQLQDGNIELARKTLMDRDVLKYAEVADSLIGKDKRATRDLLYAMEGIHYTIGRILDGDRVEMAAKHYGDCRPISLFGKQSAEAMKQFEIAEGLLKRLKPLEPLKGLITKTMAYLKLREGNYHDAAKLFRESLHELTDNSECQTGDRSEHMKYARIGLIKALKSEICQMEELPDEIKYKNSLEIIDVALDNLALKGRDPDYVSREIVPDARKAFGGSEYDLCGANGARYRKDVNRLIRRLLSIKNSDIQTLVDECRAKLAKAQKNK